jgi:hypothetical protein
MDPNIRNFSQIEKFIKENPKQAEAHVLEWKRFLNTNAENSPEILSIKTKEGFYEWTSGHPEKQINPSVWLGKEIEDYHYHLQGQQNDEPIQESVKKEIAKNELNKEPQEIVNTKYPEVSLPQEEKNDKRSSASSSDIRRVFEEVKKNEYPKPVQMQETPLNRLAIPEQRIGDSIGQTERGISNVGRAGSRVATQTGRAAAQAGRAAAQATGRFAAAAGRFAAQAAARGAIFLFATPEGWIIIGVIVLILIIVFLIVYFVGKDKYSGQQAINLLTMALAGL